MSMASFNTPRAGLGPQNPALNIHNPTSTHMKVITSFLAILALSAVTSFAAEGDAPKKPKMSPEEMFTKKDADKDGKISKEEFLKGSKDAAKSETAFTAKDKDKDGSLSKEEFTAAPKKKKKDA
ncbi:MAG: hypothetical protein B7Z37_00885 [Verrucomicrobia bacterium 12-59-8]|nr:MAG: hypothetical protein B7Z37_00885 [Verrucomicrobia bacterium 12-59-8]